MAVDKVEQLIVPMHNKQLVPRLLSFATGKLKSTPVPRQIKSQYQIRSTRSIAGHVEASEGSTAPSGTAASSDPPSVEVVDLS